MGHSQRSASEAASRCPVLSVTSSTLRAGENRPGMTVEAHGFQPCDKAARKEAASAAVDHFADRTFFVTSVTWERRDLFRSERAARLFLDTLFSYRDRGIFQLYEFVMMPDHIHLLLAPKPSVALERVHQRRLFPSVHERNWITDGDLGEELHESSNSRLDGFRKASTLYPFESCSSRIRSISDGLSVLVRSFRIRTR